MNTIYPKGPESVAKDLNKPTSKYKLHAWMALGGLCTFVFLYFGLIYLFASTAIRSFQYAGKGDNPVMSVVLGVVMAFLALFMTKALFFIKRFDKIDDIEITAEQEPELFKFINQVADDAGAPRPHHVYLSGRVNASVFYDLSIINLIFPTRKNLEIGLGLVNSLSLNEFKAILAHEFGHFAQKTMAIGRWVYISRQIVSHIITTRDWFDNLIQGLSRVDLRVAWLGWIISICVWCIRALMDTLFSIVVLAERALSREMEFNADLVAVSLTGSDAIVNGLYKLDAADHGWEQSVQYSYRALHEGKSVEELFSLQKYYIQKVGVVLDNPQYGTPPINENKPDLRIFKKHLATPPKMWSTHPSGFEREENAKRTYIYAPQDDRSSWILFKDAEELKRRMTKHLFKDVELKNKEVTELSIGNARLEIDKDYNKVFYDPKYRGFYLKQSLARSVSSVEELYSIHVPDHNVSEKLKNLYPESLKPELELYESKNEELLMLQALYDKQWDATGGVILHEGKELKRKDLPEAIAKLKDEVSHHQKRFLEFNKGLRSLHFKIAQSHASSMGNSWGGYLKGLSTLIHYAEHSIAIIVDKQRVFHNTLQIVLADGKVSDSEMNRLLLAATDVTNALDKVFSNKSKVDPGPAVLARMEAENWSSQLEEFKLGYANVSNINGWIQAVDSWIDHASNRLEKLKEAALEELILSEEKLVVCFINSSSPGVPQVAANISYVYPILLTGNETVLQSKLSLRDRFFSGDGLLPSIARFGVAASIIGIPLFAGQFINKADVIVFNGLSIPITVHIANESVVVEPLGHEEILIPDDKTYTIEARTEDGSLIEKFNNEPDNGFGTYIYNIASAAAMLEWSAYYTSSSYIGSNFEPKQHSYGAARWFKSHADYFFTDPPETVEVSGSYEEKTVLTAYSEDPSAALSLANDKSDSTRIIRSHTLWDDNNSKNIMSWLMLGSMTENGDSLLATRLERNENDVLTLRSMQDGSSQEQAEKACRLCKEKFSKDPESADLYYLTTRCMEDGPEQDKAFIEGYKKWPDNAWLSFAAGYAFTSEENWDLAEKALTNAIGKEPSLVASVCVDLARIHRLKHDAMVANTWNSEYLDYISRIESNTATDSASLMYVNLYKGKLDEALQGSDADAPIHSFILRFAAASDGASDEIIEKCMKLKPAEGINLHTLSPTIGLWARKGKDVEPYMGLLQKYVVADDFSKFDAFLKALRNGTAPDKVEAIIKGLSIQTKGYAYVLGSVYLDKQCPRSWKEKATKFLFVTERPNFLID